MNIDFQKYKDGLVPAIAQDSATNKILMLGFMDQEALDLTQATGKATFFSRSRQKIWVKGETSGNFMRVTDILPDCDADTLLLKVEPAGPVCHTGTETCFNEKNDSADILFALEDVIRDRREDPAEDSYTSRLFAEGLNRVAQKVGEEAVELIIEAKDSDDEAFKEEAADLLFHFLVLLSYKGIELKGVYDRLRSRSRHRGSDRVY